MTTGEKTIDVQTMVGEVKTVSSRGTGWKMDVAPNDWFNVSQYGACAMKPLPAVGDLIEVDVTAGSRGGYWVDDWRPVEAEPRTAEQVAAMVARHLPAAATPRRDDKPVVTRLACLNAAIATLTQMEYIKGPVDIDSSVEGILGLAERFVTWATWGGVATVAASATGEPEPEPVESEPAPIARSGRSKST